MKRIVALIASVLTAACGVDRADQFRRGVPQANDVKINVPGTAGQALSGTAQRRDALEGQRADFYVLTRVVTLVINGGTVAVLGLVKAITDHPPTTLNANTAVWGPHTEALSPNTYKFTVTKNQE